MVSTNKRVANCLSIGYGDESDVQQSLLDLDFFRSEPERARDSGSNPGGVKPMFNREAKCRSVPTSNVITQPVIMAEGRSIKLDISRHERVAGMFSGSSKDVQ